jgi:hypothetical protein
MASVVLGGTDCLHGSVPGFEPSVCGGCGQYATSLILTFLLQATPELNDAGAEWEQEVFLPLASAFSYPGLRASYMAQRSIQDQIDVRVTAPSAFLIDTCTPTFAFRLQIVDSQNQYVVMASYAVMFVYITLALGKFPHPVLTRAVLGFQGICIVALSVVGAIGVTSWAGMHITMIVNEVVPFLILALGTFPAARDRNFHRCSLLSDCFMLCSCRS